LSLPPLQEAAERGDATAVSRLLLDKNVDVNEKAGAHRAYRTALHRAAGYGHLAVVIQLLKVGVQCTCNLLDVEHIAFPSSPNHIH